MTGGDASSPGNGEGGDASRGAGAQCGSTDARSRGPLRPLDTPVENRQTSFPDPRTYSIRSAIGHRLCQVRMIRLGEDTDW